MRRKMLPRVIFGTSCLGNLYTQTSYEHKKAIISACVEASEDGLMFDTAGKYGAGMSLEVLAKGLKEIGIGRNEVKISNKLGWYRVPLIGTEPTFEKGVWAGLSHDAVQKISYEGILECYHQGNELLGDYQAQYVSVHDPDEYLAGAADAGDYQKRYKDILDAYIALAELKKMGAVHSIGIGAKDWRVIQKISKDIMLDYVMIANSLTVYAHPKALLEFISELKKNGVSVINSAIFHGGFLTGGDFYNYEKVDVDSEAGRKLLSWRKNFFTLCDKYHLLPAEACFGYVSQINDVESIALSTTRPGKVQENIDMINKEIPQAFWLELDKIKN